MPRNDSIQVRRDTAANWTSVNPTLASGEIGFETDTRRFKIGNGTTPWNALGVNLKVDSLAAETLVEGGALISYNGAEIGTDLSVGNDLQVANNATIYGTSNIIGGVFLGDGIVDADSISADSISADSISQSGDYLSPYNGFRNHLINGGFDVWQRGTSIAGLNNATSYAADRWAIFRSLAANYTLSRVAVSPSELTGFNYCARYQRSAGDTSTQPIYLARTFESISIIPLAGKTVTYSFYARKGANYSTSGNNLYTQIEFGTGTDLPFLTQPTSPSITNMTSALTASWQRFQTTLTIPVTATAARIFMNTSPTGTAGANDYFEITGVQLEIGSVATPFEQRPIGTELALCQRYFQRHSVDNSNTYIGAPTGSGSGFIQVPLIVQMRTTPTFSVSSGSALRPLTTGGSIVGTTNTTSIVLVAGAKPHAVQISFSGSSGLTAGAVIGVSGNAGAYFDFSGEL